MLLVVVFLAAHSGEGDICVAEGIVSPGNDHPIALPQAVRGNTEIIPHVQRIDERILVVHCGKVCLGNSPILPGLPCVAGLSHKGIDQKVPAVATPVVKDCEHLPILVYLQRREHLVHLEVDGIIVDATGPDHVAPPFAERVKRTSPKQ